MKGQQEAGDGLMLRLSRHKRHGVFMCLIAVTGLTGGCYGRFPMTHALYNLNGGIENGVLRNVAFWLLVIFPVYWFAQVGDAIIFNLIEFWTGAGVDLSAVSTQGDTTVTLQSSEDRSELVMTISKAGEADVTSRFVRLRDGRYEMRDEQDNVLGKIVRTPRGDLNLTDADGKTLRTIGAAELAGHPGA